MPEGKDPTAPEVPAAGAPPAPTPPAEKPNGGAGDGGNGGQGAPAGQGAGQGTEDAKALQDKLDAANKELEKLRSKEMNFDNLRKAKLSQLSDEEKSKLSEREKALMEQTESLEKRLDNFENTTKKSTEESVMKVFSNGDTKLEEKMLHFYDEFKSASDSPDQIKEKMKRAYILATAEEPKANPIGMAQGFGGAPSSGGSQDDFSRTPEGVDLLRKIDPNHDWTR